MELKDKLVSKGPLLCPYSIAECLDWNPGFASASVHLGLQVLATHVGDSDSVLGSRLQSDPASATVGVWTVNQWMGDFCLSVCVLLFFLSSK